MRKFLSLSKGKGYGWGQANRLSSPKILTYPYKVWQFSCVPRIKYLMNTLSGLTAYLYFKDHGPPHLVVRKGSGKRPEAQVKIRIDNFEVLENFGFSKKAVNAIIKSLRAYQETLLEDWYETQSK
jgi:hypothetical protein